MTVPTFDEIEVGQTYNLGPKLGIFKVGEKNVGTAASAEGEIPWHFAPVRLPCGLPTSMGPPLRSPRSTTVSRRRASMSVMKCHCPI